MAELNPQAKPFRNLYTTSGLISSATMFRNTVAQLFWTLSHLIRCFVQLGSDLVHGIRPSQVVNANTVRPHVAPCSFQGIDGDQQAALPFHEHRVFPRLPAPRARHSVNLAWELVANATISLCVWHRDLESLFFAHFIFSSLPRRCLRLIDPYGQAACEPTFLWRRIFFAFSKRC